ncbi:MAG: hypothetical protein ABW169_04125, partial [Sphingobium sp.]
HSQFWALGVHQVSPVIRQGPWIDALRAELDRLECGKPVIGASRGKMPRSASRRHGGKRRLHGFLR